MSWIFTFIILFAGSVQKDPTAELYQIFSEARQFQLKESPLFATYAEKELGKDFDVREFHDAVLWNGAVPLDVLEELIKDWVGSQKN